MIWILAVLLISQGIVAVLNKKKYTLELKKLSVQAASLFRMYKKEYEEHSNTLIDKMQLLEQFGREVKEHGAEISEQAKKLIKEHNNFLAKRELHLFELDKMLGKEKPWQE